MAQCFLFKDQRLRIVCLQPAKSMVFTGCQPAGFLTEDEMNELHEDGKEELENGE